MSHALPDLPQPGDDVPGAPPALRSGGAAPVGRPAPVSVPTDIGLPAGDGVSGASGSSGGSADRWVLALTLAGLAALLLRRRGAAAAPPIEWRRP